MKTPQFLLCIFVACVALALAVVSYTKIEDWSFDIGRDNPADTARAYVEFECENDFRIQAESVFMAENSEEILETLDIADVSVAGDYAVAFYRYSIGTDIFRKSLPLRMVEGKWYSSHDWKYSSNPPSDEDWLSEVSSRIEEWEEQSAKSGYEY